MVMPEPPVLWQSFEDKAREYRGKWLWRHFQLAKKYIISLRLFCSVVFVN